MRSPRDSSSCSPHLSPITAPWQIWHIVVALCIAVVVAVRPLGLDRDYQEYLLTYEDAPERSARIMWSGLGFAWRLLSELGVPFTVALVVTTFAALAPKVRIIASQPYAIGWCLYYACAMLLLHEYTQIRVALAMGCALAATERAIAAGRLDTPGALWAAVAIWVHPTIIIFAPWWLCWSWLSVRPRLMVLLSALPALVPLPLVADFASVLHPDAGLMLPSAQDWPPGNPFSTRNMLFLGITLVGAVKVTQLPSGVRPTVGISIGCLSFWYATSTAPVFAHRILELSLLLPMFWIPHLQKNWRRLSMLLVGCLGALLGYLFVIDPTFLIHDR